MVRGGGGEGEAFWRFSLAFYARPGVAPALIALQDRDGRDVNVILYAVWLGVARGHAMSAADLAAAESAAAPLRDAVVAGLRGLRRGLRSHPDADVQALRRRIQALEIAAERAVQRRLVCSVRAAPHPNPLPAAAGRGRDPRQREGEGPARAFPDRLETAFANLALSLGPAAGSAEAETIRAAVAGFSRRV